MSNYDDDDTDTARATALNCTGPPVSVMYDRREHKTGRAARFSASLARGVRVCVCMCLCKSVFAIMTAGLFVVSEREHQQAGWNSSRI